MQVPNNKSGRIYPNTNLPKDIYKFCTNTALGNLEKKKNPRTGL